MPPRSARRAAPRRLRAPPALVRGSEALPASAILDELPGGVGVVLWSSARNVALWAATPPARRGRLFDPAAGAAREAHLAALEVDAELLAPLSVIVRLLEDGGRMEEVRLVNACRRIALWAEQRGALGTALEFAQCAALVAPEVAALAYAVGRLARRRAEYDRAETWLGRAVVQARRGNDWRTYALAYSGLGNVNVQKGNFPLGRRAHERCLKTAQRHNLRDLEGAAYHDLFAVALESGADSDVDQLAQQAFVAYGPGHPNLPRLAFDVVFRWMQEGFFADSLRVARVLTAHFATPCDQALALSMVARSAGGAGNVVTYEDSRRRIAELGASEIEDAASRVFLGLAHGAASLSRWSLAREFASAGLASARARQEGRLILAAEALLKGIEEREAETARVSRPAAARLADQFIEALETSVPRAGVPA